MRGLESRKDAEERVPALADSKFRGFCGALLGG